MPTINNKFRFETLKDRQYEQNYYDYLFREPLNNDNRNRIDSDKFKSIPNLDFDLPKAKDPEKDFEDDNKQNPFLIGKRPNNAIWSPKKTNYLKKVKVQMPNNEEIIARNNQEAFQDRRDHPQNQQVFNRRGLDIEQHRYQNHLMNSKVKAVENLMLRNKDSTDSIREFNSRIMKEHEIILEHENKLKKERFVSFGVSLGKQGKQKVVRDSIMEGIQTHNKFSSGVQHPVNFESYQIMKKLEGPFDDIDPLKENKINLSKSKTKEKGKNRYSLEDNNLMKNKNNKVQPRHSLVPPIIKGFSQELQGQPSEEKFIISNLNSASRTGHQNYLNKSVGSFFIKTPLNKSVIHLSALQVLLTKRSQTSRWRRKMF